MWLDGKDQAKRL